jgi:hypothetical protein
VSDSDTDSLAYSVLCDRSEGSYFAVFDEKQESFGVFDGVGEEFFVERKDEVLELWDAAGFG